jgi:hypothetical protein
VTAGTDAGKLDAGTELTGDEAGGLTGGDELGVTVGVGLTVADGDGEAATAVEGAGNGTAFTCSNAAFINADHIWAGRSPP